MFDGEEFHSEDEQREDSGSTRGISRTESARESVRQPSVTVRREDSGMSHPQGGEVIEMEVINRSASADCNGDLDEGPNISQHAFSTSLASSLLNQSQPLENNTEQVYPISRQSFIWGQYLYPVLANRSFLNYAPMTANNGFMSRFHLMFPYIYSI
jgi:hypothetical protein